MIIRKLYRSVRRMGPSAAIVATAITWTLLFPWQGVRAQGGPNGRNSNGNGNGYSNDAPVTVTCSSNNGQRVNCGADTRGGVRLTRQLSGSPCNQDSTWGYDAGTIWVDRGCRAEFELSGGDSRASDRGQRNRLTIEPNNNITWQSRGITNARVYSQMDNQREKLFAEGRSGTQGAPWINRGHLYTFILRDVSGSELARSQIDLRPQPSGYQPGNSGNGGPGYGRGQQGDNWRGGPGNQSKLIDPGTSLSVRTNERIDVRNSDGRVFNGSVDRDVADRNGHIAIPRGSDVELVVRSLSNGELILDLDSVIVNGQRYGIAADSTSLGDGQRDGIGANKRTGQYAGGGALLGAIIGAVAGGGKGAAIGAGAGAAAGVGAQVITRGRNVNIPAESLLTFRLEQPLQMGVADNGSTRDGHHYHNQY